VVAVAPALDDSAAIIFALNWPYGCPYAGDIIREAAILHNLLDCGAVTTCRDTHVADALPVMILVLDNYDSFTFNLVQGLGALGADVHVAVSDTLTIAQIERLAPSALVVSPGPGTTADAGVSARAIEHFHARIPILGVCLGHQVLCEVFGARVQRAARPLHGVTSLIEHDGRGLFSGLPSPLNVARYHSWIVAGTTLPAGFVASAFTDGGELMAVRHERFALEGVQFHPESFLTDHGLRMLENFVRLTSVTKTYSERSRLG
jgi:anthranilate synthase/aminodeoxychorismate synthase-like glutamine amidotransferase